MRDISSVCQRARAKLIVYQIDKVASEDLRALTEINVINSVPINSHRINEFPVIRSEKPKRRQKKQCSIL